MNQINNQFASIEQIRSQYLPQQGKPLSANTVTSTSFRDILEQKMLPDSELKFSKHASMRLQSRNIELTASQQERLEAGAEKAEAKGIKESLVMVDSLAFIVNVPSKTVVTAMDQKESMDNIYTNIDGAVII